MPSSTDETEQWSAEDVKSSKLYFLDVGLMAWLLGIRDAVSIQTHAARGALFETDAARTPVIVYGGECAYERQGCRVIGWREVHALAV